MSAMKESLSSSYLFGSNAPFIEGLYEAYLENPQSVPGEWREHFDKLQAGGARDVAHAPVVAAFAQRARSAARPAPAPAGLDRKQVSVLQLLAEYRFRGVLVADIDPLRRHERPRIPELDPAYYDLTEADMDTVFNTGTLVGPEQATLREIIKALQETYCGTLASSTCTSRAARRSAGSTSAWSRSAPSRAIRPTPSATSSSGSPRPKASSASCTRATSGRSAFRWKAARRSSRCSTTCCSGPEKPDRKSTRLNSSHMSISYAVFCLKKKKNV